MKLRAIHIQIVDRLYLNVKGTNCYGSLVLLLLETPIKVKFGMTPKQNSIGS
jgi:hypothetical protein